MLPTFIVISLFSDVLWNFTERLTVGDSPTSGAKPDILQKKLSFSPSVDTESTSAPSTEATNAKSADRNKKKGSS